PCVVSLGSYFVSEPAGEPTVPRPAVFFFHGGGGWGSRIFKMRADMTRAFNERGYVVIAPNGKKRPGSKWGPGWAFIPQFPPHRDDLAFTREVIADAQTRFSIDRARVLMTGYSIGGSRVSYFACEAPTLARAYAPVAGAFWRPHPDDCAGPVRLLHTHGWRDQTVPLEGRPIRNSGIEQGDVHQTLQQWRIENACDKYRPDKFITDGPFWRRIWTHCLPGTALELALHPGGHGVPADWPALVMDWFETLPGS
ncbi:MAG: polyhydroxybutyrate depolymerase, partial [Pseudomonadota bacterium]